jgi:hypothetical protein
MKTPIITPCHRCGDETPCESFGDVQVCHSCLALIVLEWVIHYSEFGALAQS